MDNLQEKSVIEEIKASPAPTAEFENKRPQRGLLGFVRRWWWALLIICCIIILVIVLPVVLVGIPHYIRSQVNKSILTIDGISATQSETNSVYTEINATLQTFASTKASIDGFNASLYLEDKLPHTPFAYLQMPATHSKGVQGVNISQMVEIYDAQAYADYNTWYLLNESLRLTVSGETYVHVSGLKKTKVNFEKTVTVSGLNGFAGMEVISSYVSLVADSQGNNLHGIVNVPDASNLTLDIGNATFTALLNGTAVGIVTIPNMYITPGNNSFSIQANVSQEAVLAAVVSEPYCTTGVLPLQFMGLSVLNNGQHLPYFEQALDVQPLQMSLNATADLEVALNMTLGCMSTTMLETLLSLMG